MSARIMSIGGEPSGITSGSWQASPTPVSTGWVVEQGYVQEWAAPCSKERHRGCLLCRDSPVQENLLPGQKLACAFSWEDYDLNLIEIICCVYFLFINLILFFSGEETDIEHGM